MMFKKIGRYLIPVCFIGAILVLSGCEQVAKLVSKDDLDDNSLAAPGTLTVQGTRGN